MANQREAHMTKTLVQMWAAGGEGGVAEEEDDEGEDEGEEEEEEEEEAEESEEDEEKDDDDDDDEEEAEEGGADDDGAWKRLVFPKDVAPGLMQLVAVYPAWTSRHEMGDGELMQAMLTGCWMEGVLETRE